MRANLLFFLLLITFACCKPKEPIDIPPVIDEPTYDGKLEVVWQTPLLADSAHANTITPIVYNNDVVISSRSYSENKEPFQLFDGETGEIIWTWDNPECIGIPNEGHVMYNNKLALCDNINVHVLDLDTGNEDWNSQEHSNRFRLSQVNDNIYWTYLNKGFKPDTCILVRSGFDNQNWKNVFTLVKTNDYNPGIEPPVSWENTNGETVLLFQNRSYNFDIGDGKIDFYAYNIDQESVEWMHEDITLSGNSSIYKPIVYNDRVYFQGSNSLHCFDIASGLLVWERLFAGAGFITCTMIMAEDRLIANGDGQDLWALNPETGETIWNNTTIKSHNSGNMIYHDGIIYFSSAGNGTLCAVRLSDGSTIWEEDSPNDDGWNNNSFGAEIAINAELGCLYTIDDVYAMCIKLPE